MKRTTAFPLSALFLSKTLAALASFVSKSLCRVSSVILFLFIFSSLSPYAAAGIREKQDISKIVQKADLIIRGKVISAESQWKDDSRGRHIYTSVTVKILGKIKGDVKNDTIAFEVVGGTVEDMIEVVSDIPSFKVDDDAVMFLSGKPLTVRQGINSKIPIYNGSVYRDNSGITADSFIRDLKTLERNPNAPTTLEAQYQPAAAQCYIYDGYRWPGSSPVISYRINENTSDCTGEGAAVQTAANTWNSVGANYTFSYAGTHTRTTTSLNTVNEIMWGSTDDSVATTYYWYNPSTLYIVECDIVFDDSYNWSSTTPSGSQMDVQTVGLHELGHWFNLGDLYNSEDSANIMYGYIGNGQVKRTLQPCDISGFCSIYGGCSQTPNPPTGVSATDGSYSDRVRVSWTASSGATAYEIWRYTSNDSGYASKIADDTASPYDDMSAAAGTVYWYWVKAKNASGTSGFSSSDSGYRPCAAPAAPTGVSATDGTYSDKVQVSWDASSGATGYEVWRYTSNDSGSASKIADDTASPYDDTSASAGVTYWYWVKAVNLCGASVLSSSNSGYRTCPTPTPPTGAAADDGAYCDRVCIVWDSVSGATGYQVWRNTSDNSGTAGMIAETSASPYCDYGMTPGATYDYWVKAANSCGAGGFSGSDAGYATTAPSAPTVVSATDGTYMGRVQVNWNASAGATGYEIWRYTSNDSGSASKIADDAASPYDDMSAAAETTYWYWVKAENICGSSGFSSGDSGYATAPDAPVLHPEPETTPGLCNMISWDAVPEANEYYVECSSDPCFLVVDYNSGWITGTSYEFCGLTGGQEYWYRAKSGLSAWTQTSQAEFQSDALTDTSATGAGDVILATGGTDTIGNTNVPFVDTTAYFNGFLVTSGTTLTQIEVYLDIPTSRSIEFVVYRGGPSFTDSYNRIHSSTLADSGTGENFYSSGPVSVPLEAGIHYMIGAVWSGSVTEYYDEIHDSPAFAAHAGWGSCSVFPSPAVLPNSSDDAYTFYHRYTTAPAAYASQGSVVSTAITLPPGGDWAIADFNITTPADTNLTVDILPAAGETPIIGYEDISAGFDLSDLSETAIRLRANLSTNDPNNTPALHDWSVTYTDPAGIESDWSEVESSTQGSGIPCDFIPDGRVDFLDFAVLASQWLQPPGTPSADIAPAPDGDGMVEYLDLADFAMLWLE